MTQFKPLFFCILTAVGCLFPIGLNAQQNQIFVITTINYPGAGNSTTPFGLNDLGDIVGDYVDSSNVRRGFRRRIDGSYTSIVAPGDTGNFTRARGINNSRVIAGDFFNVAGNAYHGYKLQNGAFTQYDFGGPFSTAIYSINNNGNFAGAYGSTIQPNRGFINIGGTTTVVTIPGSYDNDGIFINDANRAVGAYRDSSFNDHGFIRSPNGTLTFPVDFPGTTTFTVFNGINNRGWIVGKYHDAQGHEHGLLRKNTTTWVSFDYPGATATSLNAINDFGFIVGRYNDAAGVRHGFLAWFRGGGGGDDDDHDHNDHDHDH